MGFRVLACLALSALVPAVASPDTHPLECLGGVSYSKSDATTAAVADTDGSEDGETVKRVRVNCTWLLGTEYVGGSVGTDGGAGGTNGGAAPGEGSADLGMFGVFPAASVTFGSAKSPEALFGVIVYLRQWRLVHPMVRVLPVGVTTTADEKALPAMVTGVSVDLVAPCPDGDGFGKSLCRALGARADLEGVHLWKEPRNSYLRWAFNFGLRLELGEHRH